MTRFRQSDLTRAIKAATAAGVKVGRVEISPDGRIVIDAAQQTPDNPLDKWRAKHGGGQVERPA